MKDIIARYYSVGGINLELNGHTVASLNDVSIIVSEEVKNKHSLGISARTGKKRVRETIKGEFTVDKVPSLTYKLELTHMKERMRNPNAIATLNMTGLFQERFTSTNHNVVLRDVTVNGMSVLDVFKRLEPGVTLSFEASHIEPHRAE